MKEQPRTYVTHFQNSAFKHKMKRLQIPQKTCVQKILRNRKNFTYTKLLPYIYHKITSWKTQRKPVNHTAAI